MKENLKGTKQVKKPTQNKNTVKYCERKKQFVTLKKEDKLQGLKLQEDYFEIMNHGWLIDDYIAKFGLVSEVAPENTLKAYSNAIKKKYPILIAVQMLDDGAVICFKDKTLAKASNVSGYITKMTLDEIKELKLYGTDQTIPTLEEALDLIAGKVPVIVEILDDMQVGKLEQAVCDILEEYIMKYNLYDSVAIMSLNPYTLQWFYTEAPWFPRILRSGKFKVKTYGSIKAKKLTKLKLYKVALPDFICYNAKDLPCKYIKKVKPVGVLAYNVKSQKEYLDVAKYCDNIIFDGFEPTI